MKEPALTRCRSMTGYANVQQADAALRVACDLRSVNSRFLDLIFRVPDELRGLEPALRELISQCVSRGKVECRISVQRVDTGSLGEPNGAVLVKLAAWQAHVIGILPGAAPLSVSEALRWPGVVAEASLNLDALRELATTGMRECLQEFEASRTREGARLAQALTERADRLKKLAVHLQPQLPKLRDAHRERVTAKLEEIMTTTSSETASGLSRDEIAARLANEVAIFAMRADVDEELTRLDTHVAEVKRVVEAGGQNGIGKRLDFLMQELHREANTLGSKAVSTELADTAIEMKLLIEQMREQVQNIE